MRRLALFTVLASVMLAGAACGGGMRERIQERNQAPAPSTEVQPTDAPAEPAATAAPADEESSPPVSPTAVTATDQPTDTAEPTEATAPSATPEPTADTSNIDALFDSLDSLLGQAESQNENADTLDEQP